jgi:hypothetical protein
MLSCAPVSLEKRVRVLLMKILLCHIAVSAVGRAKDNDTFAFAHKYLKEWGCCFFR